LKIFVKKNDDNGKLISVTENATIVLDQLSLSCNANNNFLNQLYELFNCNKTLVIHSNLNLVPNFSAREKGYRYTVDLNYQNEVYLQLAFSPIMNFIPSNQLKIKISNHVLYKHDWVASIDYILEKLRLEYTSITELHIALDAPETADNFLKLYYDSSLKLVREKLSGKIENKRLSVRNGFIYNSRESDLYFSFYEKSLDYTAKSYIKDFHKLNDVHGNVHRIEMRSRKVSYLKTKGFGWKDLGNQEILLQIFKTEFQSRIVFNDMSERSFDNNRNKKYLRVHPIDFPSTIRTLIKNVKTKPVIESMKSKKSTVKNLFLQTVRNPSQYNIHTLREMIDQNNLREWFDIKQHSWGVHPPETVEFVVSQINEQLILHESTTPSGWGNKFLSKLVIFKFPEWKFESLASEDHLLNVA
jgi:hypothetical protein